MDVHIVVKGDTLWKIARQYGIPFEDLKRVNAHLANPDYIVPGMKIFLPMRKGEQKPGMEKRPEKPHQTLPQEKPAKPAQPPASLPREKEHNLPKEKPPSMKPPTPPATPPPAPVPLPKVPIQEKPPVQPQQPPMQQQPPRPSLPTPPLPQMPPQQNIPVPPPPREQPAPPMPPTPMPMPQFQMPAHPCFQPIMPVPCGWMPIYDADCLPMAFPGFPFQQLPEMTMPEMPLPQVQPQPTLPARLGTKPPAIDLEDRMEEIEESPIYPGRGVGASPNYPFTGWEMNESPTMEMQESPEQLAQFQQENVYNPTLVSPQFQQNPYGMMQPQFPMVYGHPCLPAPCGCSQSQGHHSGDMHMENMMPMQWQPMQWQPMQWQPMQWQPMQMFPGNMFPMQPFQQMNQNDWGC